MSEGLNEKEPVGFEEMLITNSIQVAALAQLLIEKGFFTEEEYFFKLRQVQGDHQIKKGG
jgi:hypothetical protein